MNIAIFTDHYWPGMDEYSNYIQQLQSEFLRLKLGTLTVFCAYDEYNKLQPNSTIFDELHVIRIPSNLNRRSKVREVKAFNKVVQTFLDAHLQSRKIELIHIMSEGSMAQYGKVLAKQRNLPLIASSFNDFTLYYPKIINPLMWMYLRWLYKDTKIILTPDAKHTRLLKDHKIYNVTELEYICSKDVVDLLNKIYITAIHKPIRGI